MKQEEMTSKEFRHVMGYINNEMIPLLMKSFDNLNNRLDNVEKKMVELLDKKEDESVFIQNSRGTNE